MGLKTRRNEAFGALLKNPVVQGDNIVFFKGGSTIIQDRWIQFDDLRINVGNIIDSWVSTRATRLFNHKNGILYVLITLDQNQTLTVVPSSSFNQTSTGRVSTFEDLSNKLPLILVKLEHDGTTDLSSYKPITTNMLEVYRGYGNITLRGPAGFTGPVGETGLQGIQGETGLIGIQGYPGVSGVQGITGAQSAQGITGVEGFQQDQIPRIVTIADVNPVADFIATPLSGSSPLAVQFTNLSEGSWDVVSWDFGDGNTSSSENPLHTYTSPGDYTIKLLLYGVSENSEKTRFDYVTVS